MSWWIIHFWHVFERDAVVRPLCPVANLFWWVFLFGLLPLLFVWFAVSLDETQIWLGDLRVVWLVCVVFWFVVICLHFRTFWVLVQMMLLLLMLM